MGRYQLTALCSPPLPACTRGLHSCQGLQSTHCEHAGGGTADVSCSCILTSWPPLQTLPADPALLCCAPSPVGSEQPHSRQPGRCRREDADRRLNLPGGGQETAAASGCREGLTQHPLLPSPGAQHGAQLRIQEKSMKPRSLSQQDASL